MLAAKHFDPVMGIDIHFVVIPPAGPIPIPHPHIALVLDPMDYVPIFGGTVLVGGIHRATAGTAGKPIPHIPMGGPFSKPPGNENEVFMGSATVLADGSPFTFSALPVLSCQDIGMIAPVRAKKPKKSYGMVLPMSVVIPIPSGMPVMVGGPPTIDMVGLAMAGGMAALGAAFKKLRKLQKNSDRIKKISDAIHDKARKLMDKLGVPPNVRNKVHKSICTVTGHPVDVASGKMFTDHIDFELPGPIPLVWERTWYSTSVYQGPLGHGWHHNYDMVLCEENRAVAIRMADGRPVAFPALKPGEKSFDRTERLTLIRDEQGYALDNSDGLRFRFAPHNNRLDYQPLWSIIEKSSSAQISFYYDLQGYLIGIIDSGGRKIRFQNFEDGKIHKIFLPDPDRNKPGEYFCAVEYAYRNGDLVGMRDALQQKFIYRYDHHLMIQETNRNGLSFYFEYDGLDHNARCVHTWGDGGIYNHRLFYDIENKITVVENSLGYKTTYYHDNANVYKTIDANGGVTFTDRNDFNQIIKNSDPLGHITAYEYDKNGNTVKIIQADGSTKTLKYDENNALIEYCNEIGATWNFEYDTNNRLLKETDPLGASTYFTYRDHLLHYISGPLNNTKILEYDSEKNVRMVIENDIPCAFQYDKLGSLISVTDANKNTRQFKVDLLGRTTHIKEAHGTLRRFTYDHEGNITSLIDEEHEITYRYTGFDKIAEKNEKGGITKYIYNTEEKLLAIINDKSEEYRFIHDPCSNVLFEKAFDGLTRKYIRDRCGRVTRIERNDRYTSYSLDAIGRIINVDYSDGLFEAYTYRKDGEMVKAVNNNSSVEFELDLSGNIIKETQDGITVTSEYDAQGGRTKLTSSLGGHQSIKRNSQGKTHHLELDRELHKISYTRDKLGNELHRLMPGGIHSHWQRDQFGRAIEHTIGLNKTTIKKFDYHWSNTSKIKKIAINGNGITSFDYDKFGLPSAEKSNTGIFSARVQGSTGNIYRSITQNDREYSSGGKLQKSYDTPNHCQYEYDSDGNTISKKDANNGVWKYSWNHAGQLTKVVRPDLKAVYFEYDALGRRKSKLHEGVITKWIWDGDVPLHEWTEKLIAPQDCALANTAFTNDEINVNDINIMLSKLKSQGPPTDFTTWYFEPETFSLVGKQVQDQFYPIVTDHLGTAIGMFDCYGNEVWSADLNLWGNAKNTKGNVNACPFRWPGQYEDAETGLYYNRFRYYSPDSGQYLTQDPIGLAGGKINLYGYINNVLNECDPFGLVDGGSHKDVRATNTGGEVNHMPANSVSPHSHGKGPSTWMSTADHKKTSSWGGWGYAKRWREQQKDLIQRGKFGKAIEMDIRDVQRHCGSKYNAGIKEMIDYAADQSFITRKEANRLKRKYCH